MKRSELISVLEDLEKQGRTRIDSKERNFDNTSIITTIGTKSINTQQRDRYSLDIGNINTILLVNLC
jgi:hypothetical protein